MKRVIFMCALIAMSVISSYVSAQKEWESSILSQLV